MDIIIKTNTAEELITTATVFFQEKKRLEDSLKKLERIEGIYKKELKEIQNQYHTTRDGTIMHLSKMENSHLLNTALLVESKYGSRSLVNKYINEIKKRGLVNEYFALLDSKNISKSNEPDFDDDDDEDNYRF